MPPRRKTHLRVIGLVLVSATIAGSFYTSEMMASSRIVMFFLVGSLLMLAAASPYFARQARDRFRRQHALCVNCRYDLRAHPAGQRCPECGNLVPR